MNDLATRFDRDRRVTAMPKPRRIWDSRASRPPSQHVLTPRQLECLKWVGEGKSSVDIGSILDIAPSTVNEHLAHACRRLGVRTRVQAIVECFRNGWLH